MPFHQCSRKQRANTGGEETPYPKSTQNEELRGTRPNVSARSLARARKMLAEALEAEVQNYLEAARDEPITERT